MKKFQKAIAVLLSLAMLLAFAACGASESAPAASGTGDPAPADNGGKTHIGVAYCTLAEEFAVDLQKGVQEKARELGVEISEVDYALDLSKGNDEVDNFIQMGVDAIILWPLDAAAFAGAGEKAAAAGIPVVTVDSTIDENVSCFIASDNRAGGKEAALYGLEAIGGKGKVLIITPGSRHDQPGGPLRRLL